jgi:hypothetical protein
LTGKDAATKPRRSGRLSRLIFAALLLAAAGLAGWSLAPQTLGETARRKLLGQLQDHYAGMTVSIGRGTFEPKVGLIFDDIRISESASSKFQFRPQEMIRINRLTVVTNIHPEKLLEKELPLATERVLIDGVSANAWLDNDGQISLKKLMRLPNLGPLAPMIQFRDAKIRLIGNNQQQRPVDIEISHGVLKNVTDADGSARKKITMSGRADFANNFSIACDLVSGTTDLRATVKNAHLSRDLFDRLPDQWIEKVRQARDLDCVCDTSVSLYQSSSGSVNYRLRTTIHDGRFSHSDLPRPISQLRGVIAADPTGVTIEASQGVLGDAVVRLSGKIHGYQWPSQADLHVTARGLLLDDQLASAIPLSMRRGWNALQPFGRIDIDADLHHAASRWQTEATVICKGVDVRYDKFPYPVQQLVGRVEIRNDIATSQSLDARVGGGRMQCAFRLPIRKGITNEKTFVMASDAPIAIDSTLLKALSPRGGPATKLESFIRSLSPRGTVHMRSAMIATDADGRQTRNFDLRIADGYLRYEKFAYPLHNVDGIIQVENDLVKLIGFRATNANAGLIRCDGTYRMPATKPGTAAARISDVATAAPDRSHLALNFRASNVPMDDSLRSSLPPSTRHTWDAISPSGVLDELNVMINQHGSDKPLVFDVSAKQQSTELVTNRSLSLRPPSFPYRLDITGGTVRFDGSQVFIDSINARHDASTLSAHGSCVRNAGGRWELLLNLHSGSRLHPDAELIAATPNLMREAMRRLQLRGPISLRGQTRLLMSDEQHPDPAVDWNLVLQLEGNRIADVGPVHSLRGEISVAGASDESGVRASGEVRIDSMHCHDLQLTGIRGPFAINGDRLKLGGGPIERAGRSTVANLDQLDSQHSIQGRVFDGTLRLDGEVILSRASFDVDLALSDAQVTTVLADFGHSDSDLTGTLSAKTQLQGRLGTTELLKGGGAARVRGANLYQLPLIVQVLNQLRITPTEDVAFTDGEFEYTVFGDTMTFSEMQIWGDLVALDGGGTLDRRHELDLTFNTRVSPQNTFTKVIRPLKSQKYTLWTIDVKGPLSAPEIERRSLEGVGQTIERLIPGMNTTDPTGSSRLDPRTWFR